MERGARPHVTGRRRPPDELADEARMGAQHLESHSGSDSLSASSAGPSTMATTSRRSQSSARLRRSVTKVQGLLVGLLARSMRLARQLLPLVSAPREPIRRAVSACDSRPLARSGSPPPQAEGEASPDRVQPLDVLTLQRSEFAPQCSGLSAKPSANSAGDTGEVDASRWLPQPAAPPRHHIEGWRGYARWS